MGQLPIPRIEFERGEVHLTFGNARDDEIADAEHRVGFVETDFQLGIGFVLEQQLRALPDRTGEGLKRRKQRDARRLRQAQQQLKIGFGQIGRLHREQPDLDAELATIWDRPEQRPVYCDEAVEVSGVKLFEGLGRRDCCDYLLHADRTVEEGEARMHRRVKFG